MKIGNSLYSHFATLIISRQWYREVYGMLSSMSWTLMRSLRPLAKDKGLSNRKGRKKIGASEDGSDGDLKLQFVLEFLTIKQYIHPHITMTSAMAVATTRPSSSASSSEGGDDRIVPYGGHVSPPVPPVYHNRPGDEPWHLKVSQPGSGTA